MYKNNILLTLVLFGMFFLLCTEAVAEERYESRYSIDLEKVIITPSKIEQKYRYSTQNTSIVSKDDIESSGITEITEILDLLPSVDILEYGSIGSSRSVHTRGASSSQVLTLIDGRPVNTPRDGVTDFNQIPLSNIERIEVLRGPASSMYGAGAVGGVINIVTKKGKEKMQTEVLNKAGSFSTKLSSLTHGYKIRDLDYFISYDYLTSHGHRDNADYLSNNVNTKLGYQLNDDNHISLASGYFNSEVGTPYLLSYTDLDDRQETFKKYIDVTYNGKMREGQDITVKLFHNFDRLEFIETFEPMDKSTHQTKTYGADAQISQVFFDIFRTAIGLSYQEHRLNSSTSDKHKYDLKGFYFESETDLFDKGALKIGARWDDYSSFGDRISPSASFNYWLFEKIKLHGLAAKSFRAPTFNDLYWPREEYFWEGISVGGVEGNSSLGSEKAVSYEVGVSGYFLNKFKTDLTLFKTNYDDLIEWTVDNFWWWRPENASSATIKGAELETEFVLREHLKANLNYTYLEAENRNTEKWLIYRPRHLYKLRLIYSPNSKCEFGLSAIYKTKRFTNADNTSLLSHCSVVNSNFSYAINDSMKLLFEGKNIFDRQYQEERDYSMPGRAFYSGIRCSF
ncbi:MAG: TonB-dependent receptor [Candidatus Omnitrophica bacterium]|nr:TonB-dependent receptor [Candidatus Omnitrophota bacterium]